MAGKTLEESWNSQPWTNSDDGDFEEYRNRKGKVLPGYNHTDQYESANRAARYLSEQSSATAQMEEQAETEFEKASEEESEEETDSDEETDEKFKEETETDENVVYCRVTASSSLNVREGPGTSYKVVTTAKRNETLVFLGVEDGWAHVRKDSGQEGYVSGSYIQIVEEQTE